MFVKFVGVKGTFKGKIKKKKKISKKIKIYPRSDNKWIKNVETEKENKRNDYKR